MDECRSVVCQTGKTLKNKSIQRRTGAAYKIPSDSKCEAENRRSWWLSGPGHPWCPRPQWDGGCWWTVVVDAGRQADRPSSHLALLLAIVRRSPLNANPASPAEVNEG